MRKWRDSKSGRAAKRHAKVAAAPCTADTYSQRGGGEGGRGRGRGEGREKGGGGGEGGRAAQETESWVWP